MTTSPQHIRVPVDHPSFPGHFPGRPLLPGALLLDEVLRRLPCSDSAPAADDLMIEVRSARFVSPALPGDELELHHSVSGPQSWRFELRAGDRLVMNGSVALTPRHCR